MSFLLDLPFGKRARIEREFQKRGPWITGFSIAGRRYGGGLCFDNDIRVKQFYDAFPGVRSVLELGSLEGGESFELAKRPGVSVLGIEGRQSNLEKAKFVQGLLGIRNVRFVCANLESEALSTFGPHDAVFCSGLLYHLPEPWKMIEGARAVSKRLFIWTHYAAEENANEVVNGFRGFWYEEHGIADPLSGLSPKSFWVTLTSLHDMLENYGFTHLQVLEDEPEHIHGPRVAAVAWKGDNKV